MGSHYRCTGDVIGKHVRLRCVCRKAWRFKSSPVHIIKLNKNMDLLNKKCIPCEVGGAPMDTNAIAIFIRDLKDWKVIENTKISKDFIFKNFKESMIFINQVADLAEGEGHHPDIHVYYNKVKIELMTHEVNGLTENDFIVATKIDKIKI